jgi:hypothetical protein
MKKGFLATKLFGLFRCVGEYSDLYFSALVCVHESREPTSNIVNDTLQVFIQNKVADYDYVVHYILYS